MVLRVNSSTQSCYWMAERSFTHLPSNQKEKYLYFILEKKKNRKKKTVFDLLFLDCPYNKQ